MASTSIDELDKEWLDTETVRVSESGLYLLKDGRTAIYKDGKVIIKGRWEPDTLGKEKEASTDADAPFRRKEYADRYQALSQGHSKPSGSGIHQ